MGGKVKILDQFRMCLKDIPLGTRLKRQEIIDRIATRYGTNPSSIIPSAYCYNMTNKGKPGNVNFFLHMEDGEYEYVGESYVGMSIDDILGRYRADFGRLWSEERYKWEAVKHYQTVWDINAPDFAGMLAEAFSKAGNLLSGGMYYPYKMITAFARENPEAVRELFRELYDESRPLAARYAQFRAGCDRCLADHRSISEDRAKALNHYQDLRAVSVYLSFEYPDTYFLYKYKMYTQFRDLIGFQEEKGRSRSEIWKLENYDRMCRDVLSVIRQDEALLRMQREALDDDCWPDEACHLLTQTVIYAGSKMEPPKMISPELPEDGPGEAVAGTVTDVPKNTILYGPPGTGKTRCTVIYAVAAIENRPLASVKAEDYNAVLARYREYKAEGLIEFTTFHQSYGYEDFIEGIRPVLANAGGTGDIQYRIEDGVFLQFCRRSDFDQAWELLCADVRAQGGAYTFVRKTGSELSAVLVDGTRFRVNWESEQDSHSDLKKTAIKKQFEANSEGARDQLTGGSRWQFDAQQAVIDTLVKKYHLSGSDAGAARNRVFIIDEINRGNISKIFGELITLVEPSRRIGQPESLTVRLPYSRTEFGVPDNVYLIGTMNTADRSIAAIDTALRRRFQFREMQPEPEVLAGVSVEDISVQNLLTQMNAKISVLYDREHTIGHAYFMPLVGSPTIETLAVIFKDNVIPLLQEYFYDDYEKIRLVLGDNMKQERKYQFITVGGTGGAELFEGAEVDLDDAVRYEINQDAFDCIESYRSI